MQLKGLVRFFTILLILYSIYELSFTWVVRSHERKLEAQAQRFVNTNFAGADAATKEARFKERLRRLMDSTKDVTVHYGPSGAISYQKAKEEELNLGLDLQGGINVTMEVELSGLLRSMANNPKDPNFVRALENANKRKANSNADFISLFTDEYEKVAPNSSLAALFASSNQDRIRPNFTDEQVETELRREARAAFDRTYRVLQSRIDQFGVAQPNINPDPERGIITVELPGIQDQERVRRNLQSSANLQFWEVYNISELAPGLQKADDAFNVLMGGKAAADTTAAPDSAATAAAPQDTTGNDTGITVASADQLRPGTGGTNAAAPNKADTARKSLWRDYVLLNVDRQLQPQDNGQFGFVQLKDTAIVRQYLENPAVRAYFPADVAWMFGVPDVVENKRSNIVALYAIKTKGRDKAPLEGESIIEARSDFNPMNNKREVTMRMNPVGARTWANLTQANINRALAIVMDNVVLSAPMVNQ
ncbi:MAG TPA: protein translocase subunit SecDF, partial [Chitinophagaceae bacterium]|nr:protein translocase subunit SecDF [Chitinophagaceae bacterium]